jgi:hypothetical protein
MNLAITAKIVTTDVEISIRTTITSSRNLESEMHIANLECVSCVTKEWRTGFFNVSSIVAEMRSVFLAALDFNKAVQCFLPPTPLPNPELTDLNHIRAEVLSMFLLEHHHTTLHHSGQM